MRRPLLALLAILLAATLTACGGSGGDPFSGKNDQSPGKQIVIGGADFSEIKVMQAMYGELLKSAGYQPRMVNAVREVYFPELADGKVQVVPEYAATLAEYLNKAKNGAQAPAIATSDSQQTVQAMRPLAQERQVLVLDPAKAASQNAFAVSRKFATDNNLKTLSDLGKLGKPVRLAAGEECPKRPFCQIGLEQTYKITVSELKTTGFGSVQTKKAVQSGEADLGLVSSTDATVAQFHLVVLEDDKKLQLADNLVPAVHSSLAGDRTLIDLLNKLSATLTTADLATLNAQVDGERRKPEDVARAYLQERKLIP